MITTWRYHFHIISFLPLTSRLLNWLNNLNLLMLFFFFILFSILPLLFLFQLFHNRKIIKIDFILLKHFLITSIKKYAIIIVSFITSIFINLYLLLIFRIFNIILITSVETFYHFVIGSSFKIAYWWLVLYEILL